MDIAGSQLCSQSIAIARETEKRMKTVLPEVSVVSHVCPVAMHRIFLGIHIQDQSFLVFLF